MYFHVEILFYLTKYFCKIHRKRQAQCSMLRYHQTSRTQYNFLLQKLIKAAVTRLETSMYDNIVKESLI